MNTEKPQNIETHSLLPLEPKWVKPKLILLNNKDTDGKFFNDPVESTTAVMSSGPS